mgnify:CR=1 FL=1
MTDFFQNLVYGSKYEQGLFVTIFGIAGVFIVLILFYFMIRLLTKVLPYKNEEEH